MFRKLKHRSLSRIGTFAAWLLAATALSAADATGNQVQIQLERMAQTYSHFARTTLIYNRQLRLWDNDRLAAQQDRLARELRALSGNRESLAALLEHPNPKMRTLALGALFEREDGRDLPLIASLVDDEAPTFPDLHEFMNSALMSSMGGPRPVDELESPQTVDHVAQAMLKFWGVSDERETRVTAEIFKKYWKKYEGRQYSAGWFAVKMNRATRETSPIQPEYQSDIKRVLTEMDALPPRERAWTRLFVLCPEGWNEGYMAEHCLASDRELLATACELGPEALLRFLQRKPVTDDPDLRMENKKNPNFVRIANFILRHAAQLLRPEDAGALLTCEDAERDYHGVNPAWSIGAAALQPARAGDILRTALKHETRDYVGAAGYLTGGLWRVCGAAEKDFLTDWFYKALVTARDPFHQPEIFLQEVRVAARPDTRELLIALMKHPRFELTDWHTLKEMLEISNAGRPEPLVSVRSIYDAQPRSSADQKTVLAQWRNLLRNEYDLAEQPAPKPSPLPRQILTEPVYATPLFVNPSHLILSPDGQLLATLTNGTVEIWEAKSVNSVWQVPREPRSWCLGTAFHDTGHKVVLVHQQGWLSEWDVAERKLVSEIELKGRPSSGIGLGPFAFDRAALRLGYAGFNDIACFDIGSGRALWQHKGDSGVKSVVAVSPDGSLLAAGGGSVSTKTIRLFDTATGKLLRQFDEHAGQVSGLAFSSDGRCLATATAGDGTRLWDVATGRLQQGFAYPVADRACSLVFSPDGRWLAIVGAPLNTDKGRIGVFRIGTGELLVEIQFNRVNAVGPGIALAFAPNGQILYTGARRLEAWSLK